MVDLTETFPSVPCHGDIWKTGKDMGLYFKAWVHIGSITQKYSKFKPGYPRSMLLIYLVIEFVIRLKNVLSKCPIYNVSILTYSFDIVIFAGDIIIINFLKVAMNFAQKNFRSSKFAYYHKVSLKQTN